MTDDNKQIIPIWQNQTLRRIAIYAVVLLGVFFLGLIPTWLKVRERTAELTAARRELRLCQTEHDLAAAAINARRGEYEAARQAASAFFTSIRQQLDTDPNKSDFSSPQRESMRPLLNQRDELITLLARSDPASADRLTELYVAYQKAMAVSQ